MQSKNSIAMLTSFNEVNLAKVAAARKELGEDFKAMESSGALLLMQFLMAKGGGAASANAAATAANLSKPGT